MVVYIPRDAVGLKVAQLRRESGMSQGEMARAIGLSQAQYSRLERGLNSLSVAQLHVIAFRLGHGLSASKILALAGY